MLLQTTIDDLKEGKIKIITKIVNVKGYYRGERKMKPNTKTFYYSKYENGREEQISKKTLRMYEEVLQNKSDSSII